MMIGLIPVARCSGHESAQTMVLRVMVGTIDLAGRYVFRRVAPLRCDR
jgi:hypothetical protein